MARIIAITNQKGGVGKTTTAINLSACLAEAGQHVLLVDFDPQGNASSGLGLEREDIENTVYDLLTEEVTFEECRIAEIQKNLDILPSDMNLAGAEIEFQEIEDKEKLLRSYLEKIKDDYDFILIDCPPSLNILTINALTAADTVLVPIQCEYYALEGRYPETLQDLKETCGIRYDTDLFFVDYQIGGANLLPDITVIER